MNAMVWAGLVGFIVALGLAALAYVFDAQQKALAGVLALCVLSVSGIVGLYFDIVSMRLDESAQLSQAVPIIKNPKWSSVVQAIADYDHKNTASDLEDVLDEPLRLSISRNVAEAQQGYIEISDQADAVRLAGQLLDKAHETIRATSYIAPEEWWGADVARPYRDQSREAKKRVGSYQRLFIVASSREAKSLRGTIEKQRKAGIAVKILCDGAIPPAKRKDLLIVDSSVSAELVLEQRHFKSALFYTTKTRAQDFNSMFDDLWYTAQEPSESDQFHCPVLRQKESALP